MTKLKGLLNPSYIILFVVNMIASLSYTMVSSTMMLHLSGLGLAASAAGLLIGAMSVAAMVVRPFSGWISDQRNRCAILRLGLLGIALAMAGYSAFESPVLILLMRVLHGVAFSMVTTVTMALIVGHIPPELKNTGVGYFAFGQTITTAVGPSIGMAIGARWSYRVTFLAGAAVLLAALAATLPLKGGQAPSERHGLRLSGMFAREALPFAVMAMAVAAVTGAEHSFVAAYGVHLSLGHVGWYFTINAFALFFSRLLLGRVADRYGSRVVLYPGLAAMAVACLLLG